MKKIVDLWNEIRYSLWLLPTVIVALSVALAIGAVHIDSGLDPETLSRWPRLFGGSAQGARAMLQAVAGAMITVAGLTFSITVLVLSLAASQYTPRVIRTFMGSRATQTVLGVFIGIFVYCLIVLRTVRGSDEVFVPSFSVTLAILLALVGVSFLVYFIHHIASSIQASSVIHDVARDTVAMIGATYAEEARSEEPPARNGERGEPEAPFPVASDRTGYIRTVDVRKLSAIAEQQQAVIRMEKAVGEFVAAGSPIASTGAPLDEALARKVNKAFTVGIHRTVEQDIAVGIRQLVDIALKAMSPAINDTTTAAMCIDYLSAILAKLVSRRLGSAPGESGRKTNVIVRSQDFGFFLHEAFSQIREQAGSNTAIYVALLRALETIAGATGLPARKRDIASHVERTWDYAQQHVPFPESIERIERHRHRALARIAPA